MNPLSAIAVLLFGAVLSSSSGSPEARSDAIDNVAESYVKLCLTLGLYDTDFVDAYYGPPEWKPAPLPEGEARTIPVAELCGMADGMVAELDAVDTAGLADIEKRRVKFLRAHILSAKARIELVGGKKMSFDEESNALYGAVAPPVDVDSLEAALAELESLVPGNGELAVRVEAYRADFVIPKDRIDTVFSAAIEEARNRTRAHIELTEEESFETE